MRNIHHVSVRVAGSSTKGLSPVKGRIAKVALGPRMVVRGRRHGGLGWLLGGGFLKARENVRCSMRRMRRARGHGAHGEEWRWWLLLRMMTVPGRRSLRSPRRNHQIIRQFGFFKGIIHGVVRVHIRSLDTGRYCARTSLGWLEVQVDIRRTGGSRVAWSDDGRTRGRWRWLAGKVHIWLTRHFLGGFLDVGKGAQGHILHASPSGHTRLHWPHWWCQVLLLLLLLLLDDFQATRAGGRPTRDGSSDTGAVAIVLKDCRKKVRIPQVFRELLAQSGRSIPQSLAGLFDCFAIPNIGPKACGRALV